MEKYFENVKDYLYSKIDIIKYILSNYKHLDYSIGNYKMLYDEIDNSNIISMLDINDNASGTNYYIIIGLLEQQLNNLQLMLNTIEGDNN